MTKRKLIRIMYVVTPVMLVLLLALNVFTMLKVKALEDALIHTKDYSDSAELSMYYKDSVFAAMSALRAAADQLETLTASDYWPYPSYGELLFGVR